MKLIINKVIGSVIKTGVSASSTASGTLMNEPKRPEKLK